MTYVEVAVAKVHTGGKLFSYHSDDELEVGSIVRLPYGTKIVYGVVMAIVKKPTFKTKSVNQLTHFKLPVSSLQLLNWMFEFYPDDFGLITQLFIPGTFLKTNKSNQFKPIIGKNTPLPTPTTDQKQVLDKLFSQSHKKYLLHGDTGTGKTRVYLDKIIETIKNGRSVLLLVPEIGLTPQVIDDLLEYIKAPIVLTHSSLSIAKRREIWEYALNSQTPVVYVGPRSALFLPCKDIGLIVIDEAHDNSYKQSQSPRYQSLHIAGKLAEIHSCEIVQSTATPNIDDYEMARNHNYSILRMTKLAAGNEISQSKIIDLTDRRNFTIDPYISDELYKKSGAALANNSQVMLFLNRRGSARLVQCDNCGWSALCPLCGLPMTYHHDNNHIMCHYCNRHDNAPNSCPECGSTNISYKSIGTKSLVEHAKKLFPDAKVMRFDADSSNENQYYKHINTIKNHEVDVIVGTQIISKGIDLPSLGVVGVINADNGLNLPDYRAEEVTFQQLYQVTGRVNRGHRQTWSIIQTKFPEHPVMQAAHSRKWLDFYDYEIAKRKQFIYPPFCYIAVYKIQKTTAHSAENAAKKIFEQFECWPGVNLLGPSPSFYEKPGGKYVWQIIAKSPKRSNLVAIARKLPGKWIFDIDPTSLL